MSLILPIDVFPFVLMRKYLLYNDLILKRNEMKWLNGEKKTLKEKHAFSNV